MNGTNVANAETAIGKWNQTYATKDGKLVGSKRNAILHLLTAPVDGVDAILQCIARNGSDNAPLTEDSIANKKVAIGSVWRQFQLANWTELLRVTAESYIIMCKYIVAQFEEKPISIRTKLTRGQVEEASQLAALTSALANILHSEHAMPMECINQILLDPVCAAEPNICMELQGHLHEKLANFTLMSVLSLAEHVREREGSVNKTTLAYSGQTTEAITVAVGELEKQEWELTKGMLDYD